MHLHRLPVKTDAMIDPGFLLALAPGYQARGVSGVLQSQTEREARQAQAIAPPTNARKQGKQYVEALT